MSSSINTAELLQSLLYKNILLMLYSGLGAEVCRKFASEGCNVAINYANNEAAAQQLAQELQNEHGVKTLVIQGDAGIVADCARCVEEAIKAFGGIDGVIGNAGYTKFTNFNDLDAMTEAEWDKAWAVQVKGMHALAKAFMPQFNKNSEGGFFIITSSVAGKTLSGSSMAYSVTKAAQLHLMKCLAKTQGEKLRCNAVLPGLLLTDWGNLYGDRIQGLKDMAALKKEVSPEIDLSMSEDLANMTRLKTDMGDCADIYISLAKNTSITGQNIHVGMWFIPQRRNREPALTQM